MDEGQGSSKGQSRLTILGTHNVLRRLEAAEVCILDRTGAVLFEERFAPRAARKPDKSRWTFEATPAVAALVPEVASLYSHRCDEIAEPREGFCFDLESPDGRSNHRCGHIRCRQRRR